ncbi:hypothetical protein [Sphingomonas sp.]|uniref:hypothetical protein n=1 Tax=Sphingomonas sp. TaxID=28214 RepID=UPI003B00E3A8
MVSLLELQSRRAAFPEVRQALTDAMERVAIVAQARSATNRDRPPTLGRLCGRCAKRYRRRRSHDRY